MLKILDIDNLYLRQFNTLVALEEFDKSVFAGLRIVVGFKGRGGSAKQGLRLEHRREDDGSTTGMIAGHGILLLVGCLMFLVDDDETETLKGQEHGTTGPEDDIVMLR